MDESKGPSLETMLLLGSVMESVAKAHGLTLQQLALCLLHERRMQLWDEARALKADPRRVVSPKNYPYKCPKCEERFVTSDFRNAHAKAHG